MSMIGSRGRAERALRNLLLLAVTASVGLLAACGDDSTEPDEDGLVGTWEATSFVATGFGDIIALGMDITLTLDGSNSSGTITLEFENDFVDFCDPGPNCTETGAYQATAAQITLDPGTEDEITFNYTIQGNTMTWVGAIDDGPPAVQATITFQRQ